MAAQKPPGSKLVAVLVIVLSIAVVIAIYYLTVGAKVSRQTGDDTPVTMPAGDDPGTPQKGTGPGASHAIEVDDSEAVTKPSGDKKALPPGVTEGPGE